MPTYSLPSDASLSPQTGSTWLRPSLVASWREIVVVILLVIGPFAANSAWSAGHGSGDDYVGRIMSNRYLLAGGAVEAGMLTLFLVFLHKRQWMPSDFRIIPTGWSSLQALPLLVLMVVANLLVVSIGFSVWFRLQTRYEHLAPFVLAHSPHLTPHSVHLSWIVLLGVMILNAFLEELTCIAYIFNQLAAKLGPAPALLATVLLRMSCHSYQGLVHMIGIGAVFTISGLWYWRTRNLWILILSHALLDIGSLSIVKWLYS